jgi:hypothetical protein
MPDSPLAPLPDNEHDYPHWNRVYIAVVLFTTAVIIALSIFSSIFTP